MTSSFELAIQISMYSLNALSRSIKFCHFQLFSGRKLAFSHKVFILVQKSLWAYLLDPIISNIFKETGTYLCSLFDSTWIIRAFPLKRNKLKMHLEFTQIQVWNSRQEGQMLYWSQFPPNFFEIRQTNVNNVSTKLQNMTRCTVMWG